MSWFVWRVSQIKRGDISIQRLFERLRGPFFWPLVIFLVVSIFSVFISPNLQAAAGVWKAYFIEPALLFIVILDLSLAKKSVNWVVLPLILSGLWLSVLAIGESIFKVDPFSPESIAIDRVTGVFNNPNALGLYLGPLFAVGLGFLAETIKNKKSSLQKRSLILFLIVALASFLATIYLSKSRGASAGLVLLLLFFGALTIFTHLPEILKRLSRWLFFLLLAFFLIISLLGFVNIDRFVLKKHAGFGESVGSRLCIWQATRQMLFDKPILGAGLSGFPEIYPSYTTCEPYSYQYPHNIFLNFWTELGIGGLLVFFWVVSRYWSVLVGRRDNFLAVGLLAVMVYTFIHGLVDVPYFKNDLSSQFWVFLAVAAWFASLQPKRAKTS
ncbi:MAG TPA: O-antigen ligase family protein [Candidatus Nanoarchaeia archaeon]